MSEIEHEIVEKKAAPSLRNKQKQVNSRKRNDDLLQRVMDMEQDLSRKKYNPLYGESINVIAADSGLRTKARKVFNEESKRLSVPQTQVYKMALAKLHHTMGEKDPNIANLSLKEFAVIVSVDDLPTMLLSAGTAAYNLYKQNPTVKTFVDGAISKGYNAVKNLLFSGSSQRSTPPGMTMMITDEVDAVCVGHLFGAITKDVPVVSDPSDIPRLVYTNKIAYNFAVPVNASGNACVFITGPNFASNQSISTPAFIGTNTQNSYNPDSSTTTGGWVYLPGPLGANLANFMRTKFLGMEIIVTPFVSMNASEGGYVAGFVQDQMSTADTGNCPDQNIVTFGIASQLPGFEVNSLKQGGCYRSIPSSDRTIEEWKGTSSANLTLAPRSDYGTFVMIIKGADPSATIDIQLSIAYSVLPDKLAVNLIRGTLPPLAPYTDQFMEYLRVRYPDIMFWPPEKVVALYEVLSKIRPSYRELVKHTFTAPVRPRKRALNLMDQAIGEF